MHDIARANTTIRSAMCLLFGSVSSLSARRRLTLIPTDHFDAQAGNANDATQAEKGTFFSNRSEIQVTD